MCIQGGYWLGSFIQNNWTASQLSRNWPRDSNQGPLGLSRETSNFLSLGVGRGWKQQSPGSRLSQVWKAVEYPTAHCADFFLSFSASAGVSKSRAVLSNTSWDCTLAARQREQLWQRWPGQPGAWRWAACVMPVPALRLPPSVGPALQPGGLSGVKGSALCGTPLCRLFRFV